MTQFPLRAILFDDYVVYEVASNRELQSRLVRWIHDRNPSWLFFATPTGAVQSFGMQNAIRHIENHILSFWITMQNWAKKRLWRTSKSGVAILSSFVFHILYFSPYASVLLMGKKKKFSTIQIATSIEERDKWPDARNLTVDSTDVQ